MKKIIFNVIAFAFAAVSLSSCGYNSMVEKQEEVDEKWSQVQTQYQRRSDLIGNLVEVVKGYAKHENQTLVEVTAARARATQVTLDPDKLTPENIQKFQQAQDGLSASLGKLMLIHESYPELKANTNFLELQSEVAGTENRIGVARRNFNETVKEYNTYIRKFPNNLTASMFGFEKKAYFESQSGADKAPKIEF
ncbi:MAG: LemA family protein [Cytophagaceae bacterium]|jgi:LemA protein|nr:LemA family protein [Cytophagaceae bacterium]